MRPLSLSRGTSRASTGSAHESLLQCVGSCLSDSVIVLYAASAHADSSHDLAVERQRDAAWEGNQSGIGNLDVVQRAAGLGELGDGGVVVNLGSAVVMPEVFLKALTVARNVLGSVESFTTANLDMLQHYRPGENVLRRPTQRSGKALPLIGQHEILVPLLHALLVDGGT